MSTDTKIKNLIFNKLTQEQYNNADRVPTEFYLTPDTSIDSSEKGAANGVASLDTNGKVPSAQIPTATTSTLGGVKPDGTTITVTEDGVISVPVSAEVATKADLQALDSSKADTSLANLSTAGKELASGLGMPSSRYIDLELGASGSTYTAPANGYVYILGNNTNTNCYLYLINVTKEIRSISWMYATSGNRNTCYLPVSKDDVFKVIYYEFNSDLFRFIYAEGAE